MSNHPTRSLAVALLLCAVADLAAVPLLLAGDDVPPGGAATAAAGVVVLLSVVALALLTHTRASTAIRE